MKALSIVFAAAVGVFAVPVFAEDAKVGPIEIIHPWSRATPKGASVAAGYVTLRNTGTAADRLIGGTIAAADGLEIHEMKMDGAVMKMREIPGGLEIKPGETVTLKPGGFHFMFVGLKAPLEKGKPVRGTLRFEQAGNVEVTYEVEAIGGQPSHGGH
jgi:periplasmic copper chaperone A